MISSSSCLRLLLFFRFIANALMPATQAWSNMIKSLCSNTNTSTRPVTARTVAFLAPPNNALSPNTSNFPSDNHLTIMYHTGTRVCWKKRGRSRNCLQFPICAIRPFVSHAAFPVIFFSSLVNSCKLCLFLTESGKKGVEKAAFDPRG